MALEHLAAPPINEVICGVTFEPLPMDPVQAGLYLQTRRGDFGKVELHPGLADEPETLIVGLPPIRTWLVSKDDVFVVQLQHDRMYLNWRLRGGAYPRFNDHGGRKGVLSKFGEEFGAFSEFCKREYGRAPKPLRTELSKVDHLVERAHWEGIADLKNLLPWLGEFISFSTSDDPALALRFQEKRDGGRLTVAIDTGLREEQPQARLIKVETRLSKPLHKNVIEDFQASNQDLNAVFERLVPKSERDKRFHTERG